MLYQTVFFNSLKEAEFQYRCIKREQRKLACYAEPQQRQRSYRCVKREQRKLVWYAEPQQRQRSYRCVKNVATELEKRYFREQRKLASARRDGAFTAQKFTPNLLVNLLRIYRIRL